MSFHLFHDGSLVGSLLIVCKFFVRFSNVRSNGGKITYDLSVLLICMSVA